MAEPQTPDQSSARSSDESSDHRSIDDRADAPTEPAWRRRRRLAEVFGDVLPDTTSDEREGATSAEAAPDSSGETPQERWLRSEVPPHHG